MVPSLPSRPILRRPNPRPMKPDLSSVLFLVLGITIACGAPPEPLPPVADDSADVTTAAVDESGFDPIEARRLTAEALALLQEDDETGARPLLEEALRRRPNYLDPLLLQARIAARGGARDEALDQLEHLVDMNLFLPFDRDPGLESLAEEPRFQALMSRRSESRSRSETAFSMQTLDADLIPESVVFDPATERFFLSSVHRRKIVTFAADTPEATTDFVVSSPEQPLFAVLGMAIDAEARLLWAVSCPLPQMQGFDDQEPESGVLLGIDLDDGKVRHRLVPQPGEAPIRLNDVTVGADGQIFVSDSQPPGRLFRADGRAEEPVLEDFGEPGLRSPQGLALSADGATLFVADYSYGIAAYGTTDGHRTWLPEPDGFFLSGIDGLTRAGDDLLAIQNGVRPHRVLRLRPDGESSRFVDADILDMDLAEYSEPTLGTWLPDADGTGGRFLYVANSQWDRFDAENRLPEPSLLKKPVLLGLSLD